MPRRLDYRPKPDTFAWLDEREDQIFARYLEVGRILDVMNELKAESEEGGWPIAYETIYEWLRLTPSRTARWDDARALRGHLSHDEAQRIAENATQQDANASRLKYEARKWAAETQNRSVYGKKTDIALNVGLGDEWLQALTATTTEAIEEADHQLLAPGDDTSDDGDGSPASAPHTRPTPTGEDFTRASINMQPECIDMQPSEGE